MHVEEYSALRAEILKRLEFQNQIKSLTLVSAGVLTTVALEVNDPTILLGFPILVFFLAMDWAENNQGILRLATYIQTLETRQGYEGWETVLQAEAAGLGKVKQLVTRESFPSRALFPGTQLFTLFLGYTKAGDPTQADVVIGGVSVAFIVATVLLQHSEWFGSARAKHKPQEAR